MRALNTRRRYYESQKAYLDSREAAHLKAIAEVAEDVEEAVVVEASAVDEDVELGLFFTT